MNYHASVSRYPFVSLLVFGSTGRPRPKLWNDSFLTAQPWILCTWWAIVVGRFAHDRNQGCCGTRRKTQDKAEPWISWHEPRPSIPAVLKMRAAVYSLVKVFQHLYTIFIYRKIHIASRLRWQILWNRCKNACKTSLFWSVISIRLEDLSMCHIYFIGMPL